MSMNAQAGECTRNLLVADIVVRTGIDEAMIERLVRTFYGRARRDPLIGPVFESAVKNWENHMARLWWLVALSQVGPSCDFSLPGRTAAAGGGQRRGPHPLATKAAAPPPGPSHCPRDPLWPAPGTTQ
jgi:hypothetical protein